MPAGEIRYLDRGTQFLVTLRDGDEVVDLSDATTLQLLFKKPSSELLTKTATLYTNGTDGKIYYLSNATDLNEVGTWYLQAFIIIDTDEFHSDIASFKVHRNLG